MNTHPTSAGSASGYLSVQASVATATLGADGTVIAWTPEPDEWLGYSAKDILGQPVTSLLVEESDRALIAGRFQKGDSWAGKVLLRRHEGSNAEGWLRLDSVPNPHETGTRMWLATITDIESMKRAGENSALLKALFDSSHIGLVIYDAELHITFANTTLHRWLHVPDTELVGRSALELPTHVQLKDYERALRYVLMTGRSIVGARFRSFEFTDAIYDNCWSLPFFDWRTSRSGSSDWRILYSTFPSPCDLVNAYRS
ncbi:PAS domain-containing protein [Streptomyces sp. CA-106110]|uniref:PAS domain-containing protein n=1 Tax=Streptomyces sp. CA-106110 TaxID=3240044 RepID=UPI003D91F258